MHGWRKNGATWHCGWQSLTMWVLVSFGSVSGQGSFGGGDKVDEDEDDGVRVLLSRWLLYV